MPIEALTIGPVHTLAGPITVGAIPAVIYALPARRCLITVQPDTASISVSNDQSDWDTVPNPLIVGDPFQFEVSAAFIRCNDADVTALIRLAA